VDKADPLFDCGELRKPKKAAGGLIVSGRDATAVLKPVEEAFDPVSSSIQGTVARPSKLSRNSTTLFEVFGRVSPAQIRSERPLRRRFQGFPSRLIVATWSFIIS